MTTQPEALLEAELVNQLRSMGYGYVAIQGDASLLANLQAQLGAFNGTTFTQRDMTRILNHLQKGTLYDRSKVLRDRYALERADGTVSYVRFFDGGDPAANKWQVTQQVTNIGSYTNRYDVTILCNGLPVVQVELKRRGLELKEAFNQVLRYKRQSFWANGGLFQYIQLFAISNGVNTKYYVNNPIEALTFAQTFYWTDEHSRRKSELKDFAADLLSIPRLGRMLGQYIVLNDRDRKLMVLRPYQVYAVEAIVDKVRTYTPAGGEERTRNYGYIWHTTGSGKTLTSFKASQVIMGLPQVAKVVFVVDRKDLDYKTMQDFNDYKEGSVDATENTRGLVEQLADPNTPLIVTTIQKLHIAISKVRHERKVEALKDQRMVFIFDECHRSQFGKTHGDITSYFPNAQLFGFTGTPIFAENASTNDKGKRTTRDLFGECLHKYVITDAIRDENVLRFSVEYVGRYKQTGANEMDIEVEDIDRAEVFDDEKRLVKVVDHILSIHDRKTHDRQYSALFAISSIPTLLKYYDLFRQRREAGAHDLRIAAIYSYGTNEEDEEAVGALPDDNNMANEPPAAYGNGHSREKLDRIITDYNAQFGTAFSTTDQKGMENYFKDITKKLREREKKDHERDRIDLVLVVNMMLTGFDAKKVNTLYVDKKLRYHGLIQAYSRTNRILNEKKSQGNIVTYRNLKKATDDALALFSNKEAKEVIFLPPYQQLVAAFIKAYKKLIEIAPTYRAVDALVDEEQQLAFVAAFRELIRLLNVLKTYAEFDWNDLPLTAQQFADYTSKYLDLRDSVQRQRTVDKHSILEDIDFETVLVHRDEINVAYILKLLARLKAENNAAKRDAMERQITSLLNSDIELRSKRELIEKFIAEHLPKIEDADRIQDEFAKYWEDQRVLALQRICEEEHLDQKQFANLIEAYVFTGQEPLKDEVFKCLEARPSVLKAREIGERIVVRMKEYVDVFLKGMVA